MKKIYINIGQRVEKSFVRPYGWRRADYIPEDETCVLVLGGSGANDDRRANAYAKDIDELLEENNLKEGVKIYSVVYRADVESDECFMPFLLQKESREQLLEKYGHKDIKPKTQRQKQFAEKAQRLYGKDALSKSNPEILNPPYIERLFEKVLLYRISENGQKLELEEAMNRVRKLNVVAHCHGGYVFVKLEEMMRQKMIELGYLKEEREAIQKQLLCVALSPYAPLGVSKSTMISFGSARDSEVWHQNAFHRELLALDKNGDFRLSYFPEKQGNVFVASSMVPEKTDGYEHSFSNYVMPKRELSKEGKVMLLFARLAILNGVKSSVDNEPLKSVQELLCGDDIKILSLFDYVKKTGQNMYAKILCSARKFAAMKGRG